MRFSWLCLLTGFLGSCQLEGQTPPAIAQTAPQPPTLLPGQKILSKNRRFVYAVRWYAPKATIATLDTVVMTASGQPWELDTTQTCFEWRYRTDTTSTSIPKVNVGAIENKEQFWIHPPRYANYRILELNPFPDIRFPARRGRTWDWKVYPPDMYADSAWASWKGVLTVEIRYKLLDSALLATPLGRLRCYRVQGIGTSKLGTTALESYFHPAYGFVRLEYRNIDRSRVQMEMIEVDVRPESAEKVLEQMFQPYGLRKDN